jgi:hypothetical protein
VSIDVDAIVRAPARLLPQELPGEPLSPQSVFGLPTGSDDPGGIADGDRSCGADETRGLEDRLRAAEAEILRLRSERRRSRLREKDVCVVCMDAPRGTCLVPCGHFALCDACGFKARTCPICRCEIEIVTRCYRV